MTFSTDEIFALLPAWMRLADAEEGARVKGRTAPGDPRPAEDFGPLRTLASLFARETQITAEAIEALADDAFIETCAPWVVPYLGDLLGMRGLAEIPEGIDMRARTADALVLRARKGTLGALEQAAADGSNLPVLAVEYGRRLALTPSMRLVHPERGGTVDVRDRAALARVATPFERCPRRPEMRRIEAPARGRWMLGNVGLHVWPLQPMSITGHRVNEITAGARNFRFHPLGCDAALWDAPHARPEAAAAERDIAAAIARAVMAEDPGRFYGPGKALSVRVDGIVVPLAEIRTADLGDRPGAGPGEPPWNRSQFDAATLIDPERGRLVIGRNRTGAVEVSCHFARLGPIGGGEHDRAAALGSVETPVVLPVSASVSTRISDAGGEGSFVLARSTHYTAGGTIEVPAGKLLRLLAADGAFPTLRLGAELVIRLGAGAEVELNGIRLWNRALRLEGAAAAPGALRLIDCTLVPGRALTRTGAPEEPGAVMLEIAAPGARVELTRVICGAIRLASDTETRLSDCVLDAQSPAAPAVLAAPGAARQVLSLARSTVLGTLTTDAFAGGQPGLDSAGESGGFPATTDTLFCGAITVARRQTGCLRFCRVPAQGDLPRLYRCTTAEPRFLSTRYADPRYLMRAPASPDAITRGAEDHGEIGLWSRAALTQRFDNLSRARADFLRFGHAAQLFPET